MKVNEVMTPNVEVVGPNDSLQAAARKMKDLDVGPIPVCDGERLLGMVTDRDIAIRGVAEGKNPAQTQVSQVMTPGVLYCFEDQGVQEAARMMQEHQVRRLLVLNRDKKLVGIVALGDLAVECSDQTTTAQTLEHISEPAKPKRAAA